MPRFFCACLPGPPGLPGRPADRPKRLPKNEIRPFLGAVLRMMWRKECITFFSPNKCAACFSAPTISPKWRACLERISPD